MSTKSTKRKVLVRPPKTVIPGMKLYANDNTLDRATSEGGEWTLPNDKSFPTFLRRFDEATRSQPRTPMKLWNESEKKYADIGAYSHQKFVSDFMKNEKTIWNIILQGFLVILQ